MNATDYLLHWLSERGRATPAQMHRACEGLRLRLDERARQQRSEYDRRWQTNKMIGRLYRSGHIERLSDGSCCVVPTTILIIGSEEGHWYGARTMELRRAVQVSGIEIAVVSQDYEPELWRVLADEAQMHRVAEQHSIAVERERGAELLRSLPALHAILERVTDQNVPVAGTWAVFKVNEYGKGFWTECDDPSNPGLYRDITKRPFIYVWRDHSAHRYRLVEDIQVAAAKWQVAGPRAELTYDVERRTLIVGVCIPLPILVERALRTVSGRCARFVDRGRQVYFDIEEERAKEVARILNVLLK